MDFIGHASGRPPLPCLALVGVRLALVAACLRRLLRPLLVVPPPLPAPGQAVTSHVPSCLLLLVAAGGLSCVVVALFGPRLWRGFEVEAKAIGLLVDR